MGNKCCETSERPYEILEISDIHKISDFEESEWPKDQFLEEQLEKCQIRNKEFKVMKLKEQDIWYEGGWKNGELEGEGIMFVILHEEMKIFYEGHFQGMPQGKGKAIFYPTMSIFQGQIEKAKAHGKGTFKNQQQRYQFTGVWRQSKPFKGVMNFKLTSLQIDNDQAVINYPNGRTYSGQINQKYVPNGKGKVVFADQSFYEGDWKDGYMHGRGQFHWNDGSSYEGEYFMGYKNGSGKYSYGSGQMYDGQWRRGDKNGHGKYLQKDGSLICQGQWKNGIMLQ